MASGIYRIDLGNENFYIGSAVNLKRRENEHHNDLKRQVHRNKIAQNCWDKYGVFEFTILEECTKDELLKREQIYLDKYFNDEKNINIALVASNPMLGRKHSNEARAKMSAWQIGRVMSADARAKMSHSWKLRASDSDETRAKKSASSKGKPKSAEHRAKISAAAKLRPPVSAETRAKLSAAQLGKTASAETRAKISMAGKLRYKREAT